MSRKRSDAAQRPKTSKTARKRPASAQASAQKHLDALESDLERESVVDLTGARSQVLSAQLQRAQIDSLLDGLDLSAEQADALRARLLSKSSATDERLAALKQSIAEQVADNERAASRDLIAENSEAGQPQTSATDQTETKRRRIGRPFAAGFDERRNLAGRPKHRTLSEAMRAKLAEIVPGAANIDQNTYAESLIEVIVLEALQKRDLRAIELTRKLTEPDRVVFDWRGKARMMGYDPDKIASVVSSAVNAAMVDTGGDSGRADTESDDEDTEQDTDD